MSDKPVGIANGLTNYGDRDFSLYLRRSFAQSMGYSLDMLKKPVVGIAYTPSGFNNCHRHFPELLQAVKRGVLAAGALPVEFPTISLGEVFLNPTSLKFRNLMSIDTEEMIRAQPMDAVVLMGGCDKTVPAQLMGCVSAAKPAVMLIGGPMMTGRYHGERLGACTDCRRFWAMYRAGKVSDEEINVVESRLATTAGSCAVMGTASTMACITEALGMCLPGTAAIPAVHADRLRAAEATGALAVRMIGSQLTPDKIVNRKSVENAVDYCDGWMPGRIPMETLDDRLQLLDELTAARRVKITRSVIPLVKVDKDGARAREDIDIAALTGSAESSKTWIGPPGGWNSVDDLKGILAVGEPDEIVGQVAEMAARGIDLLAAPVSGNAKVIKAGRLSFVCSGPQAAYERALPYLKMIAPAASYVGEGELARIVKICHNVFLGVVTQSLAEITVLAQKAGVPRIRSLVACRSPPGSATSG